MLPMRATTVDFTSFFLDEKGLVRLFPATFAWFYLEKYWFLGFLVFMKKKWQEFPLSNAKLDAKTAWGAYRTIEKTTFFRAKLTISFLFQEIEKTEKSNFWKFQADPTTTRILQNQTKFSVKQMRSTVHLWAHVAKTTYCSSCEKRNRIPHDFIAGVSGFWNYIFLVLQPIRLWDFAKADRTLHTQ